MNTCRSCPTEIHWLTSPSTGRLAPIEVEAHANGNIRIDLARREYQVITRDALKAARGAGERLHRNHFLACPNAKGHLLEHRK